MKIPGYQSQVQPPSSTGNRFISDASGPIVQGLNNLAGVVQEAQDERQKKEQYTKITDAATKLQRGSLNMYLDAEENRQGALALADENEGRESVADDYQKFSSDLIQNSLREIDPQYHEEALGKLNAISENFLTKFSIFQSKQRQANRMAVMQSNIQATEDTLRVDMARGGNLETINNSLAAVRKLLEEGSGGKDFSVQFAGYKQQVLEDAIVAAGSTDAERALTFLDHEDVIKTLGAEKLEALRKHLEKQNVEQQVEDIVGEFEAKNLPYETRLALIDKIKDRDIRTAAYDETKRQERVAEERKTKEQFDTMTDYYDRIRNQGETISALDVFKDARLDFNQRDQVASWIKNAADKPLQLDDVTRYLRWTEAQDKILSGEFRSANDIRKAVLSGNLDIRDGKSVENDFNTFITTGGRTYQDLSERLAAKYETIASNPTDRAQVLYGANEYIRQHRQEFKTNPTRDDIEKYLDWSVKGILDSRWWWPDTKEVNQAQDKYPAIADPQGRLISKGDQGAISLIPAKVNDLRINGDRDGRKFPKAYYDASRKWFILGEPDVKDGYYYIEDKDGNTRRMTTEKWKRLEWENK